MVSALYRHIVSFLRLAGGKIFCGVLRDINGTIHGLYNAYIVRNVKITDVFIKKLC